MERNVPKLRFKGFNDEWEEKKLGSMGKALIGLTYSPDNISDKENGLLVLRSSNIKDGHLNYNDNVYVNMPVKDDIRVRKNDILLCSRNGSKALIGKSALIDSDINATFGAFMTVIRANNGKFINQLINTREFFRQINMNLGATINQITSSNLNNFKFKVPSHQEQERIANFLTKVDKIIEKQEEKVKNLENYKKGMIQKIFSQEIRFKDENGNEYPEWEETKLGELLTFYSTNSLSRECLNFEIGEVQNIHYGDIHMKFPTILDVKNYSIPYINSNIDITKYQEDSFCKDGDLIIADASEDYADIGKSIEVCNIGNKKILAGLHTILARDNKNLTSSGFKGYMMQCEFVRKQIKVLAAGAKVLGISKANLEKVNIKLPSLQEQQRIADFLTKMDLSIEKEYYKLKELKKWKKGLLQQMFV